MGPAPPGEMSLILPQLAPMGKWGRGTEGKPKKKKSMERAETEIDASCDGVGDTDAHFVEMYAGYKVV